MCFHAHASAEKYIKARLHEAGITFPKTHDLEVLLNLALPMDAAWASFRSDLKLLNRFAVEYRYPGTAASVADAQAAVQKATSLRQAICASLGLPA